QLRRCRPVVAASDIIHGGAGREIARPEAVWRKAAHELRPAEKAAQERHALAAKGRNGAALQAGDPDDVVAQALVSAHVAGCAQELGAAAEPRGVLLEVRADAVARIARVVERVVGQRGSNG